MKTTIDRAGRLVLPKPVRDELGLGAGGEVDVRVEGGQAIIEPTVATWHLEQHGRLTVLVPDGPVPTLTDDEVQASREVARDPEARHIE